MPRAAFLPSAAALTTSAPPLAQSPPVNTPGMFVSPVSGLRTTTPRLSSSRAHRKKRGGTFVTVWRMSQPGSSRRSRGRLHHGSGVLFRQALHGVGHLGAVLGPVLQAVML